MRQTEFQRLKNELAGHERIGLALIGVLAVVGGLVLAVSVKNVADAGLEPMVTWVVLALLIAFTSSRYPIQFPGTLTGVSVSEALMFFAVIVLGPYHAALLAAVDMLVAGRRLKLKKTLSLLNVSNMTISFFVAGKVYYAVENYLRLHASDAGLNQKILLFALPLFALALSHYLLHILVVIVISRVRGVLKREMLSDTLPWEPVTYLACAIIAGMVNYAFVHKGLLITSVVLILVLPVPVIIYYTFTTYHDKLGEQERHHQDITSIYDSILEMLAMAIDAKDDVTHDHIQRVKLFAQRMGKTIGLSELEIEALKAGALLHDIGKIGVPAYILNKPGKLTEHEFEQMKMHTVIGADMLSNVAFRYPVVPIVRHHHERWDGRGYPDGLKGEAIPITARILTLVDNYDALRSDRPYKTGMSREEALAYIRENAGTFFDPRLVSVFLNLADELEAEAAGLKAQPVNKRSRADSPAMAKARPAAGFCSPAPVDRAAAALNSIAETNQRVTALYEMSRTLSSLLSLEDTFAILANRLSKLIPFSTCAISLFDATRSEFEIVHAAGLHADQFLKRRMPAEAGITGWVITNQRPMYNTNPVLDVGFLGPEAANAYRGVMVFPLQKNGESLGAIALYSTEIASYASEHIQLMESISQPAADAVNNALAFEQAQRAAFTDPITGLASMRALRAQFQRERARNQRLGVELTLIIISMDNLDEAASNSRTSADQVLSQAAALIKQHVRETDVIARRTTSTFVALLSETGEEEASEIRRRMRETMLAAREPWNLSVSMGSATCPAHGTSFDELLQTAQIDCGANRETLDVMPTILSDVLISTSQ